MKHSAVAMTLALLMGSAFAPALATGAQTTGTPVQKGLEMMSEMLAMSKAEMEADLKAFEETFNIDECLVNDSVTAPAPAPASWVHHDKFTGVAYDDYHSQYEEGYEALAFLMEYGVHPEVATFVLKNMTGTAGGLAWGNNIVAWWYYNTIILIL